MAKIKIISNPYERRIKYQKWSDSPEGWTDINYETRPNSDLLKEELNTGFFPFVVKKIVDVIVKDFQGEEIEIVFEGTDDEYKDLELVCHEDYPNDVKVTKSAYMLENARDILPDIIDVFKKVKTLVSQTIKNIDQIDRDLEKFSDASNDVIPICVVGNYSSGKSSFINALIGCEILPSGDRPVTAKIFKIKNSNAEDRAYIEFEYEGQDIEIRFDSENYKFVTGASDKELIKMLDKALSSMPDKSIAYRINSALEIINGFDNEEKEQTISDLIEITVPFINGSLGSYAGNFVIFDTPGSNSASNEKHFSVLKKAMEGFSNGLPIFVAKPDALDSKDNENLYKLIKEMEELDSRFTMIIVNKADTADLPKDANSKEREKEVLCQTIPKNLYSLGIFYVSSIMGLGSKVGIDAIIDDHYAEIFDDQRSKYENPEGRFYKQLFRYNIMPEQLKLRSERDSENCTNLIYANSGLYAVEEEIQTFAKKYSHYNKCSQSEMFLGKVIAITSEEIERIKAEREEEKQHRIDTLERDKAELITNIQKSADDSQTYFIGCYPGFMQDMVAAIGQEYAIDDLSEIEADFITRHEAEKGYSDSDAAAKKALDDLGDNFVENVAKAFKERKVEAFKSIGTGLAIDVKQAWSKGETRRQVKHEADMEAADELLQKVVTDYNQHMAEAQTRLDEHSRIYWKAREKDLKEKLSVIVTGSSVLSEEEKDKLSNIIFTYGNINFGEEAERIFDKADFEYSFLAKLLMGATDRINTEKLKRTYNMQLQKAINNVYAFISCSHEASLKKWVDSLLETILDNIIDFNPMLHKQNEIIRQDTEMIIELENKQKKLSQYKEEIRKMMDWQEA